MPASSIAASHPSDGGAPESKARQTTPTGSSSSKSGTKSASARRGRGKRSASSGARSTLLLASARASARRSSTPIRDGATAPMAACATSSSPSSAKAIATRAPLDAARCRSASTNAPPLVRRPTPLSGRLLSRASALIRLIPPGVRVDRGASGQIVRAESTISNISNGRICLDTRAPFPERLVV